MAVFKEINEFISGLHPEKICEERKEILQPLIDFLAKKLHKNEPIRLNFICTHNSRRSHLSQVWAQTLAHFFNLGNIFCYSGGTEATAVYPMIIETLKRSGFKVQCPLEGKNPVYYIKFSENEHPVIGFSKKMDDPFNPQSNFGAIMTCTEADTGCPVVPGAEMRISLPFEDPKKFDDTPERSLGYMKRNEQISTELFYVFSQLNNHDKS